MEVKNHFHFNFKKKLPNKSPNNVLATVLMGKCAFSNFLRVYFFVCSQKKTLSNSRSLKNSNQLPFKFLTCLHLPTSNMPHQILNPPLHAPWLVLPVTQREAAFSWRWWKGQIVKSKRFGNNRRKYLAGIQKLIEWSLNLSKIILRRNSSNFKHMHYRIIKVQTWWW